MPEREGRLKTLAEFNAEARAAYERAKLPQGNGIACPRCGTEMYDNDGQGVMMSNPPQMHITCPGCKHRDSRIC